MANVAPRKRHAGSIDLGRGGGLGSRHSEPAATGWSSPATCSISTYGGSASTAKRGASRRRRDVDLLHAAGSDTAIFAGRGPHRIRFQSRWLLGDLDVRQKSRQPAPDYAYRRIAHPVARMVAGRRFACVRSPVQWPIRYLRGAGGRRRCRAPDATLPTRTTSRPHISRDGAWIYYSSNRTGRYEVWKTPARNAGSAVQVTRDGGYNPSESADGRTLYFVRQDGIFAVPVEPPGQAPRRVLAVRPEAGSTRSTRMLFTGSRTQATGASSAASTSQPGQSPPSPRFVPASTSA